jgi:hypothetical protein
MKVWLIMACTKRDDHVAAVCDSEGAARNWIDRQLSTEVTYWLVKEWPVETLESLRKDAL